MTRSKDKQLRAGITGVGCYVPPKILTNADLEKMVETSDEWIRGRTGICQRHVAEPGVPASELGYKAAQQAIEDAGVKAEDIDFILVGTTTPDSLLPSTACIIQERLGAVNAACLDVNAACTGFIYALSIAESMIVAGAYKRILVIGAEVLSSVTDWTDRSTCVLFGDGAGACMLEPVEKGGILSTYLGADGKAKDLLKIPAGGSRLPASHATVDAHDHAIKMSGNEVFKLAVRIMVEAAREALHRAGDLGCDDIDCLIPHQANKRIIDATVKRLGLPDDKVFLNVDKYGNMSAASTIVALREALDEGKIKKGDTVVLVAFGGGLTWGSVVIEWI